MQLTGFCFAQEDSSGDLANISYHNLFLAEQKDIQTHIHIHQLSSTNYSIPLKKKQLKIIPIVSYFPFLSTLFLRIASVKAVKYPLSWCFIASQNLTFSNFQPLPLHLQLYIATHTKIFIESSKQHFFPRLHLSVNMPTLHKLEGFLLKQAWVQSCSAAILQPHLSSVMGDWHSPNSTV